MINAHLYFAKFDKKASRILKEIESLQTQKLITELRVYSPKRDKDEIDFETLENGVIVNRLNLPIFKSKGPIQELIRYIIFTIKLLLKERSNPSDVVNAHSIHLLLPAVMLKWFYKTKVIYDAHELETEVGGAKGMKKRLSKIAERFLIKYIDQMIVVSKEIGDWYKNEYGLENIFLIRNMPEKSEPIQKKNLFREEFDIQENELIFLYQGQISRPRSSDRLLEIFSRVDNSKHLVLMGFGELQEAAIEYAQRYSNIHFKTAVDHQVLPNYTISADVGVHFIFVGEILNHRYCMPNKLFQYLHAELPIIYNERAESMKALLNKYNAGIPIDFERLSNEEVVEIINAVDHESIESMKGDFQRAQMELYWEKDAEKYAQVYKFDKT
jgi:glycosyltransferase involved in cell wall biosynthesis